MYKAQTADRRKKIFELDENYQVDYFICYGSRDEDKFKNIILPEAKHIDVDTVLEKSFGGFLDPIQSMIINNKRVWFVVSYGGAKLCEYLHLACLFGSKQNIILGSCGGLNKELNTCDIIIPTYSYGNESSTRMYSRSNSNIHTSNERLNNKIVNTLSKYITKTQLYQGPIMTCSAMMAETEDDIKQRSRDGYYGVEMETSTIFAVSNHFSIPASGIIYIGDNLIKEQLVGDDSHKSYKLLREETIKNIFKTTLELII